MTYDSKRNTLYVGNEIGVFIKTPNDSQFRYYNVGMPYIKIYDLAIDDKTNKIYAGTTAGLWVGDEGPHALDGSWQQAHKTHLGCVEECAVIVVLMGVGVVHD